MAYYPDLTPYRSDFGEEGDLPTLSIGWLAKSRPYLTGQSDPEFKQKLLSFCVFENTVFNCLGYHACPFCKPPKIVPPIHRGSQVSHLGNGEIRVIGKSAIYAAPTLVYHYVVAHQYKPPDEFVDAVLTGPQPSSAEHRALVEHLGR